MFTINTKEKKIFFRCKTLAGKIVGGSTPIRHTIHGVLEMGNKINNKKNKFFEAALESDRPYFKK